jgi:hypothetical protein
MSFSADLSKWTKRESDAIHKVVRTVVIEIANRVITRSPVGDPEIWLYKKDGIYVDYLSYREPPEGYVGGRFRANWQYGFGSPPTGEIDATDKIGAATKSKIKLTVGLANPSGIHWIANNLPYSERLESGWSTQAPQGMVGLTELEFPEIFERARQRA